MPLLTTALVALAIFFLFLPIVTFLAVLYMLKSSTWSPQRVEFGDESDLSEAFLRLSQGHRETLASSGWSKIATLFCNALRDADGSAEGILFAHPTEPILAHVGWNRGGSASPAVAFHTPLLGGVALNTMPGDSALEFFPQTRMGVRRIPSHDPHLLYEAHRKRLDEALAQGLVPTDLSARDFCARANLEQLKQFQRLVGQGDAAEIAPDRFRFNWWLCLRQALRMAWNRKRIIRSEKPSGLSPTERAALRAPKSDNPTPSGVLAVQEPPAKTKPWKWTVGSLIVFAIAQGFWMGWSAVPVFLAVLIFHEAGHVVAMRLFRYKDVNVFFVPFLGALATADGKPWGLAPWKRAVVSLAGPLPGIVLGVALLFVSPFLDSASSAATGLPFLSHAVIILLLLNLFNLLPLGDLDGGQFMQATLFSRFPRAEAVFRVCGSLGLVYLGLKLEAPLVAAFAALPLLTLRQHWDSARLRLALRREAKVSGPPGSREEAARRVESLLASPPFEAIPDPRRSMVRQMVVRDLEPVAMPLWQSALFLTAYLVLWSPVLLLLASHWLWKLFGPAFFLGVR